MLDQAIAQALYRAAGVEPVKAWATLAELGPGEAHYRQVDLLLWPDGSVTWDAPKTTEEPA